MPQTVFQRLMAGDLPAHVVYEDEYVFAFLDIEPLSRGHLLVVPREAAPTLDQLSDTSSAAIGRVLPKLCRAMMKASGASHYNILQNNGDTAHQAVKHVHFHIIPKPCKDKDMGLDMAWNARPLTDSEAKDVVTMAKAELGRESASGL